MIQSPLTSLGYSLKEIGKQPIRGQIDLDSADHSLHLGSLERVNREGGSTLFPFSRLLRHVTCLEISQAVYYCSHVCFQFDCKCWVYDYLISGVEKAKIHSEIG